MMNQSPGRRPRNRRGISAPELAISVSILLLLVLGIIEFSRLGMAAQLLTNAAREGCRVGVIQNNALSDVQSRVNTMLAATGISAGTITAVDADPGTNGAWIIPSNWSTATGNTPITLVIRVPYTQVSWLPAPFFLGSATVVGTATLNSEHP
jgi:Flp pilus assembly protein TadG